jgi:hypothetical protein
MPRTRALFALLGLLAVTAISSAVPAQAGTTLQLAAQHLKSDPVWVDPSATPTITPNQAAQLRTMIRAGDRPIFIAILPGSVQSEVGSVSNLAPALVGATGLSGSYGVVAGTKFRGLATSGTRIPQAGNLATAAFQEHSQEGVYAVLSSYVQKLEAATLQPLAAPNNSTGAVTSNNSSGSSVGTVILWILIGLGVLSVLGLLALRLNLRRSLQRAISERKRELQWQYDRLTAKLGDKLASTNYGDDYNRLCSMSTMIGDQLEKARTTSDLNLIKASLEELASSLQNTPVSKEDNMWRFKGSKKPASATDATGTRNYGSPGRMSSSPPSRVRQVQDTRPVSPVRTTTIVNHYHTNSGWNGPAWAGYYPGSGYGNYPGYGWGYYDSSNAFVAGMLGSVATAYPWTRITSSNTPREMASTTNFSQ